MPTWGRVSRHGVFPLVESLDHVGPMARSLADAAAILQVIAGADTADPTSQCSPDAVFGEGQDKIEGRVIGYDPRLLRSEEHTSELQSLMRISYAVFCLKKKKLSLKHNISTHINSDQLKLIHTI